MTEQLQPALAISAFAVLGILGVAGLLSLILVIQLGMRSSRELPDEVAAMVSQLPEVRPNSHKVTCVLDDGTRVAGVYVAYSRWVSLSLKRLRFDPKRVVSVEPDR